MKIFFLVLWILMSIVFVSIVTLPVSVTTQGALSIITLLALIVARVFGASRTFRVVVLGLASILILRYVFWRTTSTLPPIDEPLNFVPGILLYAGEMFSVALLALSLFLVARPLPDRPVRRLAPDEPRPSVDVFIPSYNESPELLVHTLIAARDMSYDGVKTVWLLDDGATMAKIDNPDPAISGPAQARRDELRHMCDVLGVRYLSRENNVMAKAGNLNNGLVHGSGDLVVVLDADHVPARDFLAKTVGYFNDNENLFLVQTPHFFINPDPIERNLGTFETMPGENEMFYGIIQRGLDKWNASFFCGSAAVLRRRALEDGNGFSGSSITEDCETALDLHAKGWESIYIDQPMIAGQQPETFSNFIGQRSRWAQGMMQILLLRRPFLMRGLSLSQRLGYLSSTLFWLFPLARMTFVIAPLFFLFFGLQIFNASGAEFLAYTGGFIAANFLLQNFLYGAFRRPLYSELYEYAQSPYLSRAVLSAIWTPSAPSFRVTSKDEQPREARMSEISRPLVGFFFLTCVGIAVTAWRLWTEPFNSDVLFIVGFWNMFNFIILGASLGAVAERGMFSSERRIRVDRPARMVLEQTPFEVVIDNASPGGARLLAHGEDVDGDGREDLGAMVARRARGHIEFRDFHEARLLSLPVELRNHAPGESGVSLGVRYLAEEPEDYQAIGDLLYANDENWRSFRDRRRGNVGVVAGLVAFIDLAVRQIDRAIRYSIAREREPVDGVEIVETRRQF